MENINIDAISKYLDKQLPEVGKFFLGVILAIIAYYIGSNLIKWVCRVFKKNLAKTSAPVEAITFITSFAKAVLYILLIFTIAMQLGVKESSVAALLASGGVALGLALQGGLSNLSAGVIILFMKPFVAGDYIIESSGGNEGTVKRIELYYTTLTTFDNRMVMIPNSSLANSMVTNVTAMNERRLEIIVGVSYEADLRRAKDILLLLLQQDADILSDMEINIFVDSLDQNAVRIGFRAWVATDNYMNAKWRLNEKIKLSFEQAGIEIYHNRLDINIRQDVKKEAEA